MSKTNYEKVSKGIALASDHNSVLISSSLPCTHIQNSFKSKAVIAGSNFELSNRCARTSGENQATVEICLVSLGLVDQSHKATKNTQPSFFVTTCPIMGTR